MTYVFKASETFWRNFYALPEGQKQSTRKAWLVFKNDPFDPRLNVHRIARLSALARRTIHSATVEYDLRVLFYIERDTVFTVDIGNHAVYK